jgi:hypothetical protein
LFPGVRSWWSSLIVDAPAFPLTAGLYEELFINELSQGVDPVGLGGVDGEASAAVRTAVRAAEPAAEPVAY